LVAEAVATYLQAVDIRIKVRPMERAAFFAAWKEKKLPGLDLGGTGAFGNAAVHLEPFAIGGGTYARGSYPAIDELYKQQSVERDRQKRETILHKIQQLMHERAMFAPLFELGWPNGVGQRVAESGFGLIPLFYYTGPYEDIRLKE
jgi:peptide/nickel transport system substrate-binding protein